MNVQRAFAWILGLSILLLGASGALAQKIQKESDTAGVTGKVLRVSPSDGTLTVIGPDGENGIYWTDAKTTILNGDKKIKLTDIKPGWTIEVSYQQTEAKMNATYIEVVDAPR